MKGTGIVFHTLQVGSVSSCSGIFIGGSNRANGWTSQAKSNYGFGEGGDHSQHAHNLYLVIDDDLIDSPMDNRQGAVEHPAGGEGTGPTSVQLQTIDVGSMDTNATVSIGESTQDLWSTQSKNNYGNGEFSGGTVFPGNTSIVKDDDVIDAPVTSLQGGPGTEQGAQA